MVELTVVKVLLVGIALALALLARQGRQGSERARGAFAMVAYPPCALAGLFGMLAIFEVTSGSPEMDQAWVVTWGIPMLLLPAAYQWVGRRHVTWRAYALGALLLVTSLSSGWFVLGALTVLEDIVAGG